MKTRIYASVIIQNSAKEFLILKRDPNAKFAPGQWEFVNGTIEPHETAEETAVREVKEETGLIVTQDSLKAGLVHELEDIDGRWVVIPYFVSAEGPVETSDEHDAYKWVSEDELRQTPYVGDDYATLVQTAEQDKFTPKPELVKGVYRHYKGNNYQVFDVVCHSESHKWFVLYKRLYERDGPELWIRPYGMFFETVEYNGQTVPRFELLSK